MTISILKPTKGRVVHFHTETTRAPTPDERKAGVERVVCVDVWPGLVTEVHEGGRVDIKTFGPNSTYDNHNVPFGADGQHGTWRYPPHSQETIEVDG